MNQLPNYNGHDKDGYADIKCDKVGGTPIAFQEHRESANKSDDAGANETVPRCERLEWALPWQSLPADFLSLHGCIEPNITEAHCCPRDQSSHGTEIYQPGEGLRCTARAKTQVSQRTERPGRNDCHVGHAILPGAPEELRQLVICGHRNYHSRTHPTIGVTCGPSGDEDTSVDNRRESTNAGLLDGNDPWGRVGVTGAGHQAWVGRIDDQSNEQSTKDVKERNAVSDIGGGFRDGLVRVHALACRDDDNLNTNEGERSVDKRSQEA